MRSRTRATLAAAGLLALWIGWGTYVTRHTDRVPYETLDRIDGVELRRYPRAILVETTAGDGRTAFGRLFRYIAGANEGSEEVAMTAPVRTPGGEGEAVPMTAPVRTDRDGDDARMAFYLPEEYTLESAPVPTDPTLRLVVEPERTVAARRFSWYVTPGRTERNERALLETLRSHGIEPMGTPFLLRYNDPWTPPFMRRNEVAVEVEAPDAG